MCVVCVVCVWCVCGVCGVVCVWCVCGVCVCGVCGTNDSRYGESVLARADDASNSGGRTPGSKLPPSPPPLPALMAGEPLAVYLCTRPYQLTQPTNRYVEHLVTKLQLEKLYGQLNSLDHGKPTLRHDKDNTNCNCGSTNVFSTAAPEPA